MRSSGLTTDGQTDRQTDGEKSARVELRFAAKNINFKMLLVKIFPQQTFFKLLQRSTEIMQQGYDFFSFRLWDNSS